LTWSRGTSGRRAAILRSETRAVLAANAAADDLRYVRKAGKSLAAVFIECLNRAAEIGAAVDPVS
jgi:hypothetical protein